MPNVKITDRGCRLDVPCDTDKPAGFDTVQRVLNGLARIDYEQFKSIVMETINVGENYAGIAWTTFNRNRLGYCMSRGPIEQGYALINLAFHLQDS